MTPLLVLGVLLALVALLWLIRALLERVPVPRLDQRAVLITGCDSGFGFDLALRCLRERMRVFAACLTEQGVQALKKTAMEQGLSLQLLEAFEMDVRSDQSVAKALEFVKSRLGPGKGLHALVNNAGITGNSCWDDWLVPEDYEEVWQVNTLGVIRVTQAFKSLIKLQRDSRIIFMVAGFGRVAFPALGPYTVSKFGLEGYADTVRTELILFGVKVSIFEPGFYPTPMTDRDRASSVLKNLWARLPDTTKQSYGKAFYEFCSLFSQRYIYSFLDPAKMNPLKLMNDAYWHAISSTWPRRRYKVGMDVNFAIIPLSLLPAELQDLIFHLFQYFAQVPLPNCLTQIKTNLLIGDHNH